MAMVSCSTVTPDILQDSGSSFDSTTPRQYDPLTSGFIPNDELEAGGMLTSQAVNRYNALIGDYRIQLEDETEVQLKPGDGIRPYTDRYGNDLFQITPEHLSYFLKLNRWKKEKRPNDTLWQKVKGKV